MSLLNALVIAVASVTLFLYGLQSFSRELQVLADGPLRRLLAYATRNRIVGAMTGAIATAILQSSSAVSALAVALADSELLALRAVMPVLIGANVGTASTAFIVSLKVQGLGAYFLLAGALFSGVPARVRVLGKAVFYFGLILFALDQINVALRPFYGEPFVVDWLRHADRPGLGILAGFALTAILQSSSVVTGVAVLLADQGLISLAGAIAVVLGANIGTTTTALVASFGMRPVAKAAALSHLVFNGVGVALVYGFVPPLTQLVTAIADGSAGLAVAYGHLAFNIAIAALFLILLTPTHDLLGRVFRLSTVPDAELASERTPNA